MSEQQFRGTLASGGTFTATSRGIEVFDPGGNNLAHFGREVISGVNRDGQVVTIERHGDTIVTLTAASITDAVGLEQFLRDNILAPPPIVEDAPPLAFDAFDSEPEAPAPPPRPPIISRPDPAPQDEPVEQELPPPPTPTIVPPPPPPAYSEPVVQEEPEPIAPIPQPVTPPPPAYRVEPQASAPPPAQPVYPAQAVDEEGGGRSKWFWGCLGCGGLLVLLLICTGVLLATGAIDPDDFDDDDNTPTPFIIIATSEEATPTEDAASPTQPGEATATEDESGGGDATLVPAGDVLPEGETATVNGVEVTYQGSRIDTEGLIAPDPGSHFLVLSFEMVNTTQEPALVSSLLQFTLLDEAGESYPVELFADIETSLDSEIPAGDTLEGEIAFEVPEDGGPFTITYQSLFPEESATWSVENE